MTLGQDAHGTDQDRGCLQWVAAVPLTLLTLLTGGACYLALSTVPGGSWDDGALAGIEAMCLITVVLGTVTLLLTVAPVVKGVLSRWWLAPSLALILIAVVRWAYIVQHYPESPTP